MLCDNFDTWVKDAGKSMENLIYCWTGRILSLVCCMSQIAPH